MPPKQNNTSAGANCGSCETPPEEDIEKLTSRDCALVERKLGCSNVVPAAVGARQAPRGATLDVMDARVVEVIRILNDSLAGKVSVSSLSKKVNLSAAQLRQLFKKDTGQSPMRYLKNLRICKAEELLRTTFLSIKEIVFLSGFGDVSHFVRDFKKRHRETPTVFRRRLRGAEEQPFRR